MTARQLRTAAVEIAVLGFGQLFIVAAVQEFSDGGIPGWSYTVAAAGAALFVILWIWSAFRAD